MGVSSASWYPHSYICPNVSEPDRSFVRTWPEVVSGLRMFSYRGMGRLCSELGNVIGCLCVLKNRMVE